MRGAGRRRSFTAIAEWAADADQGTRDALGITGVVPCESTFRRTLQHLDADALDNAAGTWAQQRTPPSPGTRRLIAVDGKTLRGSSTVGGPARHLLAALDHAHGVVQIVRRRRPLNGKKWSTETIYAIILLTATRVRPAELAAIIRSQARAGCFRSPWR